MLQTSENGIVHLVSLQSVDEVLQHLLSILNAKSITLFTIVDHSGEAAKVGLSMRPTKLVIFGNPKAGTPLMLSVPESALDLPMKILIAETAEGTTRISYNSVAWLQARFLLTAELASNLAPIEQIAAAAAAA